jgi:hypothetical protein
MEGTTTVTTVIIVAITTVATGAAIMNAIAG